MLSTRKSYVITINKASSIHKVEYNCFEHIHSALENMCSYILMFGMWKSVEHDMIDKLDFLGYCLRFKTCFSSMLFLNVETLNKLKAIYDTEETYQYYRLDRVDNHQHSNTQIYYNNFYRTRSCSPDMGCLHRNLSLQRTKDSIRINTRHEYTYLQLLLHCECKRISDSTKLHTLIRSWDDSLKPQIEFHLYVFKTL